MDMPKAIHGGVGTHRYIFEQDGISVRVDRVHSGRDDTLTAEITVLDDILREHLHQARLNLTSTSSRQGLAKHLALIRPAVEWVNVLEYACVLTLRHYREGEPVVQLGELVTAPNLIYRLDPFLIEGAANVLFGYGGMGKSMFALYLAVLISQGILDNDLDYLPGPVLFLDYETSQHQVASRLQGLRKALGFEGELLPFFYRYCSHSLASEIETVQAIVNQHNIQLVIVDSVGMATGGEQLSEVFVQDYFRALRSLRITSLSIDHRAKSDTLNKKPSPYGNVYKYNQARNIWELRSKQDENNLHLGLYHTKINDGPERKPFGFRLAFEDDLIGVFREDVRSVPELVEGMATKDRIVAALLKSPKLKSTEIAEILDIPFNTAKGVLARYKGKLFVSLEENTWGLLQRT